jgi:hypothetical protein
MTDKSAPALENNVQKEAYHRLNPASSIQGQTQHYNKKIFQRVKRKKRTHLVLRRQKNLGDEKEAERMLLALKEILSILPEIGSATAHSTKVVVERLKKLRRDVETGHGLVKQMYDTLRTQRKEIEFLSERLKAHDDALCAEIRDFSGCVAYYRAAPQFNAFAHAAMDSTDIAMGRHSQPQEHA